MYIKIANIDQEKEKRKTISGSQFKILRHLPFQNETEDTFELNIYQKILSYESIRWSLGILILPIKVKLSRS